MHWRNALLHLQVKLNCIGFNFKECRQKASETLPGLGQSVRRLSNLAYPTAPLELRDTLAKEQFIDALVDSEMRLRIKQSRPKGLNDAIRLAVELEAYNTAESKTLNSMGHLRHTTSDERTETPNSSVYGYIYGTNDDMDADD
ncbi:Hypothetical predicted protein [Mytilus galloprovincialis]|uniref:Uncharacterized protein n=1 Tax=Mytilus galloprovincialis TaxID=29158 RepID=A0A8B6DW73_MYTGA|nr:Hypothetical predicted protein [Mytilus galloprovincialis]